VKNEVNDNVDEEQIVVMTQKTLSARIMKAYNVAFTNGYIRGIEDMKATMRMKGLLKEKNKNEAQLL